MNVTFLPFPECLCSNYYKPLPLAEATLMYKTEKCFLVLPVLMMSWVNLVSGFSFNSAQEVRLVVMTVVALFSQGRLHRQAFFHRVLAGSNQQTPRPHRFHQEEGRRDAGRVSAWSRAGLGVPAAVSLKTTSADHRWKDRTEVSSSVSCDLLKSPSWPHSVGRSP